MQKDAWLPEFYLGPRWSSRALPNSLVGGEYVGSPTPPKEPHPARPFRPGASIIHLVLLYGMNDKADWQSIVATCSIVVLCVGLPVTSGFLPSTNRKLETDFSLINRIRDMMGFA